MMQIWLYKNTENSGIYFVIDKTVFYFSEIFDDWRYSCFIPQDFIDSDDFELLAEVTND